MKRQFWLLRLLTASACALLSAASAPAQACGIFPVLDEETVGAKVIVIARMFSADAITTVGKFQSQTFTLQIDETLRGPALKQMKADAGWNLNRFAGTGDRILFFMDENNGIGNFHHMVDLDREPLAEMSANLRELHTADEVLRDVREELKRLQKGPTPESVLVSQGGPCWILPVDSRFEQNLKSAISGTTPRFMSRSDAVRDMVHFQTDENVSLMRQLEHDGNADVRDGAFYVLSQWHLENRTWKEFQALQHQ